MVLIPGVERCVFAGSVVSSGALELRSVRAFRRLGICCLERIERSAPDRAARPRGSSPASLAKNAAEAAGSRAKNTRPNVSQLSAAGGNSKRVPAGFFLLDLRKTGRIDSRFAATRCGRKGDKRDPQKRRPGRIACSSIAGLIERMRKLRHRNHLLQAQRSRSQFSWPAEPKMQSL